MKKKQAECLRKTCIKCEEELEPYGHIKQEDDWQAYVYVCFNSKCSRFGLVAVTGKNI